MEHTHTDRGERGSCPLKAFILWQEQPTRVHVCAYVSFARTHANTKWRGWQRLQAKRNQSQTNQVAIFIHKIEEPRKMGSEEAALPRRCCQ